MTKPKWSGNADLEEWVRIAVSPNIPYMGLAPPWEGVRAILAWIVSLGPIQICLLWQRQKGKTSTVAVALGFARLSFSWKQTSLWRTPFYCTAVQTVRVVSHCVYWQLLYILEQQILAVSWFQTVLARQHCSNEDNGNVSLLALNKKAFAHLEAISLMNTESTFYRPGIGGIA